MRAWGLAAIAAMAWTLSAGAQTAPPAPPPQTPPPAALAAEPPPPAKLSPRQNSEKLARALFGGVIEGAKPQLVEKLVGELRQEIVEDPNWRRFSGRDRADMEAVLRELPEFLFGEFNTIMAKMYPIVGTEFAAKATPEDLETYVAFFDSPMGAKVIRKIAPVAIKYGDGEGKIADAEKKSAAESEVIEALSDDELVAASRFFASPAGQRLGKLMQDVDPAVKAALTKLMALEQPGVQLRTQAFICKRVRTDLCPRT
jgi:hypothetical protein